MLSVLGDEIIGGRHTEEASREDDPLVFGLGARYWHDVGGRAWGRPGAGVNSELAVAAEAGAVEKQSKGVKERLKERLRRGDSAACGCTA